MDVAPHRNASKVSSARQMHFSNIRPMKRPCAIAGKGIFSAGCSFEAIPAPDAQQTSWFQRFEADAPEMLWLADPRRTNRLSALYQRFSAFQNTELSNSLSPPAEPGLYQCNYRPVSDDFGRYPVRLSRRDSSQLYTPRYLSQYCAELNSTGQERNCEEFAHIVPFNQPAPVEGMRRMAWMHRPERNVALRLFKLSMPGQAERSSPADPFGGRPGPRRSSSVLFPCSTEMHIIFI